MSYKCEFCNREFSANRNLTRHKRAIHENMRYECDKCKFQFRRIGCLIAHQTTDRGKIKCEMNVDEKKKKKEIASREAASSSSSAPPTAATSSSTPLSTPPPSTDMQYCEKCAIYVRKNGWSHHMRTNAHKLNYEMSVNEYGFISLKSAFNGRFNSLLYKNVDENRLDTEDFLKEVREPLILLLSHMLNKLISIKWNIELFCEYIRMIDEEAEISIKSHQTKMIPLIKSADVEEIYCEMSISVLTKMSEFQERDSGWTLIKILHIEVNVVQCNPL